MTVQPMTALGLVSDAVLGEASASADLSLVGPPECDARSATSDHRDDYRGELGDDLGEQLASSASRVPCR